MATDTLASIVRYGRAARLFHTAVYLTTFILIGTGWWLLTGHEGRPSPLASAFGMGDTDLHRRTGWLLGLLGALACTFGVRASMTFVRETIRVNRHDARWFLRWPAGAARGNFAPHSGHFDPGQRLANIAFAATLTTLLVTGFALTRVSAGETFATLDRVHRYATYTLAALVIAHVGIALGILPGYRGAWRAMHLRGQVPRTTAQRLWPATIPPADAAQRAIHLPIHAPPDDAIPQRTAQTPSTPAAAQNRRLEQE